MASTSGSSDGKPTQQGNRPSLSGTLAKIRKHSDNPRKVQEGLVLIRKQFLKEKTGIDRLRQYGGVKTLVEIIQGTSNSCINIALSILGNICMDTKVQLQLINGDCIDVLGKVVGTTQDTDVLNRACRALGNLAQNPIACRMIHEVDNLIGNITDQLVRVDDVNCQLTLIRTIRLLSDSASHNAAILNEEGLRAVALCLKSEDEKVLAAAYQCVLVLSKEFSDSCARQIVAADAPAAVLGHLSHTKPDIKKVAFKILMQNWMAHPEMRVAIGNAGGVSYFIEQIKMITVEQQKLNMANALCLSCCEVVNRVRVKDNGGLQIMLGMLQSDTYSRLHDRLISALSCFLYDESSWEILIKNDLVPIAVAHLRRVAKLEVLCQQGKEKIAEHQAEKAAAAKTTEPSSTVTSNDSGINRDKDTEAAQHECTTPIITISKPKIKESPEAEKNTESKAQQSTAPIAQESTSQALSSEQKEGKSNLVQYSIDSPTYKSVVDWTPDDYMSGPKNILESDRYQCSSPDRLSGYSSPSNYGPYSPLSVSSFDLSPDTSPLRGVPSPPIKSPDIHSPSSPQSSSTMSLMWSPAHSTHDASSISFSVPSSPDIFSDASSPLFFLGGENDPFMDETLHFSSSDDEKGDFIEVPDVEEDDKVQAKEDSVEMLSVESLGEAASNITRQERQRLNSDTSDTDASTDGRSTSRHKRTPLSSKTGTKRKRDVTPEVRKKILLTVERSQSVSSSGLDLSKMLSAKVVQRAKPSAAREREVPTNKRDRRRQTEYCLIMLLKKVSCSVDPTQDLIKQDVLATLMDYVSFADKPFSKCGRILSRLTKNTECFETTILEMVPQLIEDKLVVVPPCSTSVSAAKGMESQAKDQPIDNKEPKSGEVINRSMSACTLKESEKAQSFHEEVQKQTQRIFKKRPLRKTAPMKSEAEKLKETLFSNLAFMAETPFGQGVIEHLLLTASAEDKIKTVVSLTLVCRSKSLQTKVFVELHGFQHLAKAMQQSDDERLLKHSIHGLFTMASLRICKKSLSPTKKSPPVALALDQSPSFSPTEGESSKIVFKMDDGSEVIASRAKLSGQSDVFKAMLEGHYSEAGQAEVKMPAVSRDALQIIVDNLHGKPLVADSYELDILLEAHGLADRYILDQLSRELGEVLVGDSHLRIPTVDKIFSHAVLHEAYWMMRKCISFLLVEPNVSISQRYDKFRQLLKGSVADVAIDVIEDLFRYS